MAEFGDVNGLKKCWEEILFNQDLGKRLSGNGRQHILDNFSAKRMAREYETLYSELANRS